MAASDKAAVCDAVCLVCVRLVCIGGEDRLSKCWYSGRPGNYGGAAVRHPHDGRARHREQGRWLSVVQSQGRLSEAWKQYVNRSRAPVLNIHLCIFELL